MCNPWIVSFAEPWTLSPGLQCSTAYGHSLYFHLFLEMATKESKEDVFPSVFLAVETRRMSSDQDISAPLNKYIGQQIDLDKESFVVFRPYLSTGVSAVTHNDSSAPA